MESGVVTGLATRSQAGGSVSGSVKDKASSAMDAVARDAMAMASDAQGKVAKALEDQKRAIGGAIESFASAIRKAKGELSESDQTIAMRLVRERAYATREEPRSSSKDGRVEGQPVRPETL